MTKQIKDPKLTQAELISLRDDIALVAFEPDGSVKDARLAQVVWKINSVLYINPKRN